MSVFWTTLKQTGAFPSSIRWKLIIGVVSTLNKDAVIVVMSFFKTKQDNLILQKIAIKHCLKTFQDNKNQELITMMFQPYTNNNTKSVHIEIQSILVLCSMESI